jgi:streptomycin 6-kinase
VGEGPDLGRAAAVAAEVAAAWGIELGPPFELARFSFVAPAGRDAVLKVVPVEDDEADQEADALARWAGEGAVRLLRHDRARRALLLERLVPGTDLSTASEDDALAAAVDVGVRLWVHADAPFRWIGDHVPRWLDHAEREGAPGAELIPLARRLYDELDVGRGALVHGDFHHHNLLRDGARWVAIDPKPMLGEPEYDVAPFLWNPLGHRLRRDVTERRIAAFAEAGLDEERIRAWALIRGSYLGAEPDEAEVLRRLVA